jgi:hypothetical protein
VQKIDSITQVTFLFQIFPSFDNFFFADFKKMVWPKLGRNDLIKIYKRYKKDGHPLTWKQSMSNDDLQEQLQDIQIRKKLSIPIEVKRVACAIMKVSSPEIDCKNATTNGTMTASNISEMISTTATNAPPQWNPLVLMTLNKTRSPKKDKKKDNKQYKQKEGKDKKNKQNISGDLLEHLKYHWNPEKLMPK